MHDIIFFTLGRDRRQQRSVDRDEPVGPLVTGRGTRECPETRARTLHQNELLDNCRRRSGLPSSDDLTIWRGCEVSVYVFIYYFIYSILLHR